MGLYISGRWERPRTHCTDMYIYMGRPWPPTVPKHNFCDWLVSKRKGKPISVVGLCPSGRATQLLCLACLCPSRRGTQFLRLSCVLAEGEPSFGFAQLAKCFFACGRAEGEPNVCVWPVSRRKGKPISVFGLCPNGRGTQSLCLACLCPSRRGTQFLCSACVLVGEEPSFGVWSVS